MLRPPLLNFTDLNLCHCLAASAETEPSSQLAPNPFCSPTPLLSHGPLWSPPACSWSCSSTQVTTRHSPHKNAYHELTGELLGTAGRA